jgi:hypothetical protein
MGVSGQRHAPAALYPRGKNPRYPLYSRLGGPQSRSGRREQKKNPVSVGDRTPMKVSTEIKFNPLKSKFDFSEDGCLLDCRAV